MPECPNHDSLEETQNNLSVTLESRIPAKKPLPAKTIADAGAVDKEIDSCALAVIPGVKMEGGINEAVHACRSYQQSRFTSAFKEEVVNYALEVIPGGRGNGGTRGAGAAAQKYGVHQTSVNFWLKNQKSGYVPVSRSEITAAFKEKVVRYASEVVPGGKGNGSTRGCHQAARKYGVSKMTVRSWLQAQQSKLAPVKKSEITETFKEKVVQYALERVPGGRGNGGIRGACAAAQKFGVHHTSVYSWLTNQKTRFLAVKKISDKFKKKVVSYALEVVPGGRGNGGTRGCGQAARKYGVSKRSVLSWLKYQQSKFVSVCKSVMTDAFKKEVISYALEVVPEGKGNRGTRGFFAAARKYGVYQSTVHSWLKNQKYGLLTINTGEMKDKSKEEGVGYALKVPSRDRGNGSSEAASAFQKVVSRKDFLGCNHNESTKGENESLTYQKQPHTSFQSVPSTSEHMSGKKRVRPRKSEPPTNLQLQQLVEQTHRTDNCSKKPRLLRTQKGNRKLHNVESPVNWNLQPVKIETMTPDHDTKVQELRQESKGAWMDEKKGFAGLSDDVKPNISSPAETVLDTSSRLFSFCTAKKSSTFETDKQAAVYIV